jgi:hypothetical protein
MTVLDAPPTGPTRPQPTMLERKLLLVRPIIAARSRQVWDPVGLAERYPTYLMTIHSIIQASVPLMQTALHRLDALATGGGGPPLPAYREYLEQHIVEETNHDEWCLQDLDALGVGRAAALNAVPTPEVADHVGSQYFWILHTHPVALLGHMAVMEGFPPTAEVLDRLSVAIGRPEALRCVAHHAVADPTHSREIFDLVASLGLPRRLESLIGLSALNTARTVSAALAAVVDGVPGGR